MRDQVDLAENICILVKDISLQVSIGHEGRKRLLDKFNIKKTTRKYKELYHNVMNRLL